MRNIIFAAITAFALAISFTAFIGTDDAYAQNCQPGSNACKAANWAASAPAVSGPRAPTTASMACVRVVTYGRTEILWIEAGHQDYMNKEPFHVQRSASGYVEDFPLHSRWTVTESCIPMSKLANISILTLCNGTKIDSGYHWALTASELRQLKARGHLTSYVPFLEIRDRQMYPVSTVKSAYNRRYGR